MSSSRRGSLKGKKDIRENAIVVTCSQFFVDIDLIIEINRTVCKTSTIYNFPMANAIRQVSQQLTSFGQEKKSQIYERWKKSRKFVYILAKRYKSPFNLTDIFDLLEHHVCTFNKGRCLFRKARHRFKERLREVAPVVTLSGEIKKVVK